MKKNWRQLLISSALGGLLWSPSAWPFEDYQHGLELLQAGHYVKAAKRLQAALQQQPHDPNIAFALGVAYYQMRNYAAAFESYRQALKELPPLELQARLYSGLGDVSFALEDHEQAIGYYQQALFYNTSWLGVRLRLAESLLKQKYFASALQELTYILRYEPLLTEAYRLRSLVYLSQQDFERALRDLEQVNLNQTTKSFDFYVQLNWLYRINHKWDEAIAIGQQLVQTWGISNPDSYRILADSLLAQLQAQLATNQVPLPEHYDRVLQYYQRYTLSQPNNPLGHYKIGQLYQIQGDLEQAHVFYKQAYQLFPQRLPYLLNMLEIESALGRYPQAFQTLVRLQPVFEGDIHYWEARVKFDRGQDTTAILAALELWMAKETKPEWLARGLFLRGKCLSRQGAEPFVWQSQWQKAEALAPHLPEADIIRAERMKLIGHIPWAIELYRQAQFKRPDWAVPYQSLGNLYVHQQQWPQALALLLQAHFYAPADYGVMRQLEQTLLAMNDHQRLKPLYERALITFPSDRYFQQHYLEFLQP